MQVSKEEFKLFKLFYNNDFRDSLQSAGSVYYDYVLDKLKVEDNVIYYDGAVVLRGSIRGINRLIFIRYKSYVLVHIDFLSAGFSHISGLLLLDAGSLYFIGSYSKILEYQFSDKFAEILMVLRGIAD